METYGRLTVLRRSCMQGKVDCRCACGSEVSVYTSHLKSGATRSCGCLQKELAKLRGSPTKRHGHSFTSDTKRASPTYSTWKAAKQRCLLPSDPSYAKYGGRGIQMCERWRDSFEAFLTDMGERPPGTSLDRIAVDGHYEPGNCRWASRSEQQRNRRDARRIMYKGELRGLADVADEVGILKSTLHSRIVQRGWDVDRAVSTPVRRNHGTN